jgi:phosphatidylserine/phosphatidylglycerophosphate/cardiolipin synthase-like enzyme
MKKNVIFVIIIIVCIGLYLSTNFKSSSLSPNSRPAASGNQALNWRVYFSPDGGCTDAIVSEINAAASVIRVQAYSFTSKPIAKALVDAKNRGIDVQVILDKSQRTANYSSADFVAHAGMPTYIDAEHAIAHNKIIIIDNQTVITGSFNFSKAAEDKNAENLLILKDSTLAKSYLENWQKHLEHSEKYAGR